MMTHLLIAACVVMFLASAVASSAGPPGETQTMSDTAREVLEPPFHFLLKLPGYAAAHVTHDADIFSTWGELVLATKDGGHPTRAEMRKKLTKAARNAGWVPVVDVADLQTPALAHYGIEQRNEDLALQKTSALPGQNPPTRYSCRIWISNDGKLIIVAYRVDGE